MARNIPLFAEERNALHRYVTVIMKSSTKTFGEIAAKPVLRFGAFRRAFYSETCHLKTFCAAVGVPPTTNYSGYYHVRRAALSRAVPPAKASGSHSEGAHE